MSRNQKDVLTKEVLEQLIGDPNDDGIPVILAKRLDPQIPCTCDLRDYGFEGLRQVERFGKTEWEPHGNFVLIIDGETGNCRIPDTPQNRVRLERLSKVTTEVVKRKILDTATNEWTETDEAVTSLPTYRRMEENLAQSSLVEAVAAKVVEMMGRAKEEPVIKRQGRKAPDPDNILDPIR